eukprot:1700117-Alexandrium_andersonii.AAC.1
MSASLVGSEMCIRDRVLPGSGLEVCAFGVLCSAIGWGSARRSATTYWPSCLLYTSDAADDM